MQTLIGYLYGALFNEVLKRSLLIINFYLIVYNPFKYTLNILLISAFNYSYINNFSASANCLRMTAG